MSVSGNQRTKPNQTSNRTTDPIVSPISTDSMGEFLGLGLPLSVSDEMLIDGLLSASCQFYIDYSNNELLSRTYTYKSDKYPTMQEGFGGLGLSPSVGKWWISFDVWPVASIESVTADEVLLVVTDDYTFDLDSKPSRLFLNDSYANNIAVEYTAGYATQEEIPRNVLTGIQLLTSYLYEHRGACDITNAIKDSGAEIMWCKDRMYLTL